jgi:peptide/nickel transport system permease protein
LARRVTPGLLRAPRALISAVFVVAGALAALFAPLIGAQDSFDPAVLNLKDGFTPPMSRSERTGHTFWLGADGQGRDVLSVLIHGARVSLFVAGSA